MASKRVKGKSTESGTPTRQQSLQFINLTNAPHVDEGDRDIIRTQAMNDYHQRKRTNNPRSSAGNVAGMARGSFISFNLHEPVSEVQGEPSVPDLPPPDALASKRTKVASENSLQASVWQRPGNNATQDFVKDLDLLAGHMDPLMNLPRECSDRTRMLIHHYCQLPSLHLLPL